MRLEYPCKLTKDENDTIIAEFPDIPEAMTVGADADNAKEWAQDALLVALSSYIEDRKPIPNPSTKARGQHMIPVPPKEAIKLFIYQDMLTKGITQAHLAKDLHVDARQVRRILDLDHDSTLSQLCDALYVLGSELIVDVQKEKKIDIK